MRQKDLLKEIKKTLNITNTKCLTMYSTLLKVISENLKTSIKSSTPKRFYISNFGTFEVKTAKSGYYDVKSKTVKWRPFKRIVK